MRQLAAIMILSLLTVGCSKPPASTPTAKKAAIKVLPIEFTLQQRSTTAVPGSDGELLITIDDITRNQVMTTAATKQGTILSPQRSLSPGDSVQLNFEETPLVLHLNKLDNALAGEDFATFALSHADQPLSETQKIERLIEEIAGLSDATFIRNDNEHTPAEAAEHMRSKWKVAGDNITTAQEFIDEIASKSSVSGAPYKIRFTDGRIVDAGDFLGERLRKIEQGD